VNYAYKASGALDSIGTSMIGGDALSTTNVIDSLSYRAFGSASQVKYGNDRKLDLTYNAGLSQLTNMTATRWDGSDKMIDNNYTYAENGLISRTDDYMDTVYSKAYTYNYRNQLTTVYGYNYSQSGYGFDNFGNMLNGMTFPKIGTSDTPSTTVRTPTTTEARRLISPMTTPAI
jgi:hypothetical protein